MAEYLGDISRWGQSLVEIKKKPEIEKCLERLDKMLPMLLARVESCRARSVTAKNEMMVLVSFYLVFQAGLMTLLTSVANASKCNIAWRPAVLCALAFLAVSACVHDKFVDKHDANEKRQKAESDAGNVQNIINQILKMGEKFQFANVEGTIPQKVAETFIEEDGSTADAEGTITREVTEARMTTEVLPTESAWASQHAVKKWADKWADMLFLQEARYLDIMIFLFFVFVLVFAFCFTVCS